MKCPFCGLGFDRENADASCEGCPLSKGCKLIRCPNCGYEMAPETGLVKLFKSWRKRDESGRKA